MLKRFTTVKSYLGVSKPFNVIKGLHLHSTKTLVSGAASLGAMSFVVGVPLGVGIMAHIAVHEIGHALAFRYYSIPHNPITFVPILGAYVSSHHSFGSAHAGAIIALAGPAAGAIAALSAAAWGMCTANPLAWQLCAIGAAFNGMNMLPIGNLDGGQIATAISRNTLFVGTIASCAVVGMVAEFDPFVCGLLAMGVYQSYRRYSHNSDEYTTDTSSAQRVSIVIAYATVASVLGGLLWYYYGKYQELRGIIRIQYRAMVAYSHARQMVGLPLEAKLTFSCRSVSAFDSLSLKLVEIQQSHPQLKLEVVSSSVDTLTIVCHVPFHLEKKIIALL